jgi:chorismate mutase/prephenate dehydratase
VVLGKEEVAPSGKDKTSLLVVAKHEAGALFDLLSPFKDQNINILQLAL